MSSQQDSDDAATIAEVFGADHDRIEALLTETLAQVGQGDLVTADETLAALAARLLRHHGLEEQMLFPLFDRDSARRPKGPVSVDGVAITQAMAHEHRQIERCLIDCQRSLTLGRREAFLDGCGPIKGSVECGVMAI